MGAPAKWATSPSPEASIITVPKRAKRPDLFSTIIPLICLPSIIGAAKCVW